jgi:hypothetical protein
MVVVELYSNGSKLGPSMKTESFDQLRKTFNFSKKDLNYGVC